MTLNAMRVTFSQLIVLISATMLLGADVQQNLVQNGSFEDAIPRDQFGNEFKHWFGWKYEGDCELRTSPLAHSGKASCLLFGGNEPKIRVMQKLSAVPPGRYQVTAWLRALDVSEGKWGMTLELAFDEKYIPLKKKGTFGWTPLSYVLDVPQKKDINAPSFGLWGSGYLWIDDVAIIRVDERTPLTPEPVFGKEQITISPPHPLSADAISCAECGYKNLLEWRQCYGCGTELKGPKSVVEPPLKLLTSFEDENPLTGGTLTKDHATEGNQAIRIDKDFVSWDKSQNWSSYDYLKLDVYTDAVTPLPLSIEIRDRDTRDYWTRVNYETIVPSGKSTIVLPLSQLYVGEKSRPGRSLVLNAISRLALGIGSKPSSALFIDNIRLERDTDTTAKDFQGLYAFDFGPRSSPLMPGFKRVDPATIYSKGRGYGLRNAHIWRASNALQPDPLYQDFLCIESGGFALDLPNGKYHVFLNLNNPSDFWGEYQYFRKRSVLAQGRLVSQDAMSFESLVEKYFYFWDTDDSPNDDTFDKYQRNAYQEKEFDVAVTDGQLSLEFIGEQFGCSVSAVILFPTDKSAKGHDFLEHVVKQRRFFFDNSFRRVLHKPSGDPVTPSADDTSRGYVAFTRDYMQDVYYNDKPYQVEVRQPVSGFGFADEFEPLTVAIYPLTDLGKVTVTIGDLVGPGIVPSKSIAVGYVAHRLTRSTADGSVYTITPRLIIPRNTIECRKGTTRRFWLTVRPPRDAAPGLYRGEIQITPEQGRTLVVPVHYRIYPGTLDEVDIPVGPWGHEIGIPWFEDDRRTKHWNRTMAERSLKKLRDYGFTTFSGLPRISFQGIDRGRPLLDFSAGDEQMDRARRMGFTMPVVTYIPLANLNLYFKDEVAMNAAGFTDYQQFIKTVFTSIQQHAESRNWLPVFWNLGDEPLGDDLTRATENAAIYSSIFPKGPPAFTAATSFDSGKSNDPHFAFAKAVHVANFNLHTEKSVRMLQNAGGNWAFYNGGNRWTYGVYLYKAAKEFDAKFRLNWHWNATAGNPFYALDCREDDFAWCNTNDRGELICSVAFEREMREGIDDYRYMLTLARLAKAKPDTAAQEIIRDRLATFKLGDREHDALFTASDWRDFRLKMAEAITRLRTAQ